MFAITTNDYSVRQKPTNEDARFLAPFSDRPAARIPRRVALPRLMAPAAREADIEPNIKNEHRTY
jgi:hypothetical protein